MKNASKQDTMTRLTRICALAVAMVAVGACEEITNPVEEFGDLTGPFVRFENETAIGTPGSIVPVRFVMPTRVEEDVTVDFTFGGDAVFGEDFVVVDAQGNPRTDVTAAGGTASIPYRFTEPNFARDTLFVRVPFDATDGRVLDVQITGARTASGREIQPGIIETYRNFALSIEGFVDVPTGSYTGQRTGQFGTVNANVTITEPAQPVVIDGIAFSFVLSDYTGDGTLFGVPVPWAFNVTSGGSVLAAPHSHPPGFEDVTSNVTGTYDFTTQELRLNVTLTCCGASGATWQLSVARQ